MVYIDSTSLYYAAIGGALLGIATSLNFGLRGKITGMSGLMYTLVSFNRKDLPDKLSILGGMFLISGVFYAIYGYSTFSDPSAPIPFGPKSQIVYGLSYLGFIISGFLVGFGTKLSNGCTSGHGLCGLPRFSLRSFVAVCIFLTTAIIVSTLKSRYGIPFITSQIYSREFSINNHTTTFICLILGLVLPAIGYILNNVDHGLSSATNLTNVGISFLVGVIFGLGLMIAGMTRRAKIAAFLTLNENWDPSLLFVLGVGVIVNLLIFNYFIHIRKQTCLGEPLPTVPTSGIDWKLTVGALCFGLGWGIGALCPGPFLMLFSVFSIQIQVCWGLACVGGMFVANLVGQADSNKIPVSSNRRQKRY